MQKLLTGIQEPKSPYQNFITCFSLVDLTKTAVIGSYRAGFTPFVDNANQSVTDMTEWTRSRNQQRNFETVMQIIGLRAQPMLLDTPTQSLNELSDYKFGTDWVGSHQVWSFRFSVEYAFVFDRNEQDLAALLEDMNNIPCIAGLSESVQLPAPVFKTYGASTNVYFEKLI